MAESVLAERTDFIELLNYGPIQLEGPLSVAEFISLYLKFPELQIEREKNGKVTIMTPVKRGSGKRESILNGYIWKWAAEQGNGEVYSPSTGIQLPSGAIKSPDCAWVSEHRLAQLAENEEETFLKVVPDFVAEIRSDSDELGTERFGRKAQIRRTSSCRHELSSGTELSLRRYSLAKLKRKMTDTWMASGVQLAWLIDPYEEKAWIYRPGKKVEVLSGFKNNTLNGENILPGLQIPLQPFIP